MLVQLLRLLPCALVMVALGGCSINPRFDVPYTAKSAPSVITIVDKMYCELMDAVDHVDPRNHDKFMDEEMTASIVLTVAGTDGTSPTFNPPAMGSLLLAITGNASRQRTNTMTLNFDLIVKDLLKHRSESTVNCPKIQSDLAGDLNIKRVVDSAYSAQDDAGFTLAPTTKTVTDGTFSGETDFMITRSLSPLKASFLLSTIVGPNTLTFSDVYTDKLGFSFNPVEAPQPVKAIPVYIVPCPKDKDCKTPAVSSNSGGKPGVHVLNSNAFNELNRLDLLALPATVAPAAQ